MKTVHLTLRPWWVLTCALALLAAGCGASNPIGTETACSPDGAAGTDAGPDPVAPPDVAAPADAAAHPDVLPADVARPDRLPPTDAGPADGVTKHSDAWADGVWVDMTIGLLDDLELAMGVNFVGEVHIADKIHVMAGYGQDIVIMKVGGLSPAPAGQLGPLQVTIGGITYPTIPDRPPHPQYLPALTLFDAMTNVPETLEGGNPTRVSPGRRVKCQTEAGRVAAHCTFTGALQAQAN